MENGCNYPVSIENIIVKESYEKCLDRIRNPALYPAELRGQPGDNKTSR